MLTYVLLAESAVGDCLLPHRTLSFSLDITVSSSAVRLEKRKIS